MKIYKLSVAIWTILIIQGCVAYQKVGYVVPQNSGYLYDTGGQTTWYVSKIPLDINESIHTGDVSWLDKQKLVIKMPERVRDEDCKNISGFIVPMNISNQCGNGWTQKDNDFFVSLTGSPYTQEFVNSLQISIIHNGVEYRGSKNNRGSYATYTFPVKIGSINNDVLSIKYKGYRKDIPINYEMKWVK